RSAHAAVQESERIFTELISSIERKRSEVTELIRAQEKVAVSQAEGLLRRLEQDIAEMRRRDAELEQLSHSEDHIHFLQSFQSLLAPSGSADVPTITVSSHLSFEELAKSVSQIREKLEELWKEEFKKASVEVKQVHIIPPPEPQNREDFLEYFCQLTLDPKTANKHLRLSEGNTVATCNDSIQSYPDHPDRFDEWRQVMCMETVRGRSYWEAECSGSGGVDIAVTYKSISRKGKGDECLFGWNNQSWRLLCSPSQNKFRHNNQDTDIPKVSSSSRIGVYVDHRAGTLSFYSVSDTMTLLHRVQTTFTQPLYAGFGFGLGSSVNLSLPPK
ncbi:hypothetical protein MHYP_G00015250, partial [Metynnis hypsauchen]